MPPGNNDEEPTGIFLPNRRNLLATLGMGGAAALAGCSGGPSNTTTQTTTEGTTTDGTTTERETLPEVGGTYKYPLASDAESLNFMLTADTTSGSYVARCLDGAWAIKDGQEIFPLWCEPSTEDGKTWEITIREGLQWGAGYGEMTAEDWVYMIHNVFQAEDNWSGYPNVSDWQGTNPETGETEFIPVEQTGKYTFEVRLFEIDPVWPFRPAMWGQYCMPKGILEKYVPDKDVEGFKQDEEIQTLAYSGNLGPYQYETWQRQSRYTVSRNDEYYMRDVDGVSELWSEAPYFEKYTYRIIKEQSSRLAALRAGEVDAAGLPKNKVNQYQQREDITVYEQPQPYVDVLAYNMRANGWEPFRRRGVRQALACAVNKQNIAQGIYREYASIPQTMQPPWSKWTNQEVTTNYGVGENYGKEVTMNKLSSALSDTGYSYDGDRLMNPNGEQVELSLYFTAGSNTNQSIAEYISQEFNRNAGITVNVQATSSFISKYAMNSPPEGEDVEWSAGVFNGGPRDVSTSQEAWDMSVNLGFNTYPYTPAASMSFFQKKGGINYYGYYPEEPIAERYQEASTTVDEEERKQLFSEAFAMINSEQPFGFISMPSDTLGYRSDLEGPTENFASGWDYQTWYVEE